MQGVKRKTFERTPAGPARLVNLFDPRVGELPIFLLCFALIFVFYFPTIIQSSQNAGYLYTGDTNGFYIPTIMKIHAMIRGGNFVGLDYSLYSGSSDFFLSPNMFTFHPIVIIYSIFAPLKTDTFRNVGQLLNSMYIIHAVLALYFTQRLFRRVLGLDLAPAMFAGILFACSVHMSDARGQPVFFFAATLFPWLLYALIGSVERPGPARILLASVPVVLMLVSGYVPLALAGVEFACATVMVYLAYTQVVRRLGMKEGLRRAVWGAAPVVIGLAVCSLYILALYLFGKETGSAAKPSLFTAAQQLAEVPPALLRALTIYLYVPAPTWEFSIVVGLVPLVIALTFVFANRTIAALKPHELFVLLAATAAFAFSCVAILGKGSVAANLIYYFAPQVGHMHIYQRFLVFADLAFAAVITLMLVALTRLRPTLTPRIVFGILILLTCAAAALLAYQGKTFGFRPQIVIELFCAALMAAVLLTPNAQFVFVAAAALAVMPALDRVYSRSEDTVFQEAKAVIPLQLTPGALESLADYMKARSGKTYVKYADLTNQWSAGEGYEAVPKVLPYFVENRLNLSSYSGFTFYLSERAEFRARMPVDGAVRLHPDWTSLVQSGVDFILVDANEAANTALNTLISTDPKDVYPLPHGLIMAPVRKPYPGPALPLFDNGMIRVTPVGGAPSAVAPNLALHAAAAESSVTTPASLATDGEVDGDLSHGSVAHTGQDPKAWLDVDLGASQTIGSIRLWSRTDCCMARLENAWIFISNTPFSPGDTPASLRRRAGVFATQFLVSQRTDVPVGSVAGRYVRLQLNGDAAPENAFLNVAELQVYPPAPAVAVAPTDTPLQKVGDGAVREFRTNWANRMKVDLDLKSPSTFEYLFADNPRLTYRVDGRGVKFDTSSGVPVLTLPAGRHTVEIKYHFNPVLGFWLVFGLYWALVGIVLLLEGAGRAGLVAAAPTERLCKSLLARMPLRRGPAAA